MDTIRVLLGDDHPVVREGTRHILERQEDLVVVGEAGDGAQVLSLIDSLQPNVALIDVRLPRLTGIEVVSRSNVTNHDTRVLILTAHDDEESILAAMEAGASGYLLKTISGQGLVEAIRRAHAGEVVLDPVVAAKVARLWRNRRQSMQRRDVYHLTAREMQVLELAAQGLRNKEIADRLVISVRTVEGHFNSIFAKLGTTSRVQAALSAVAQGFVSLERQLQA